MPRPRARPRLGGDRPRPRSTPSSASSRPARRPTSSCSSARCPGTDRRRAGRQALPRRGAPLLPPQHGLHRGPPDPQHPGRPGDGEEDRARPRGRRRPVGLGRVGGAQAVLGRRRAGPLPRADRRHRDPDGAGRGRRRGGPAAGRDPAATGRCSSPTSSSCGTRSARWPGTGSRTATSRRTTCWPPATGWWSSTCRRWSTSSPTRPGMDFLMRDCHNMCTWFRRRGLDVDEHDLFGEVIAQAY